MCEGGGALLRCPTGIVDGGNTMEREIHRPEAVGSKRRGDDAWMCCSMAAVEDVVAETAMDKVVVAVAEDRLLPPG